MFNPNLLSPIQVPRSIELAGNAKLVTILDLDEMVFNTVAKHVRILRLAARMSHAEENRLPTLDDTLKSGGTKAFKTAGWKNYDQVNEVMRNSPHFNHHIPLIDENTPAILAQAAKAGFPTIMYLTTRPQSVEPVTQTDLARLNLPDVPVLARPDHIDLSQTTEWKLKTLITVADRIPGTVVMVDDSISLIRAISEKSHPKLRSLLFQGPITPTEHAETSTTWPTFIQSLHQIAASIS